MQQTPIRISGEIIEQNVSYQDFLTRYAGQHVEWVYGDVIQMPPVSIHHDNLTGYLYILLRTYAGLTERGRVLQAPMVMKLTPNSPGRQSDIQVLLPESLHRLRENEVVGPADIVVEVVSPESHRRDRFEKFGEYEAGGVKEYWIIDRVRKESLFYRLNEDGIYVPIEVGENSIFRSTLLPKFQLKISDLWKEDLPGPHQIVEMVRGWLQIE